MKKYKSDAFAAIHETVSDFHEIGLVDKRTMRRFDENCLVAVPKLLPEEIKAIRENNQASQAVFARYLNVTKGIVSQWERGVKSPAGTSLRLLTLVKDKGLEILA